MAEVVTITVGPPCRNDQERACVLLGLELFRDGETLMARDPERPEFAAQVDEDALAKRPYSTLGLASSDIWAMRVRRRMEGERHG